MKCPWCQHENPPQAKFCLECGARVALTYELLHSHRTHGWLVLESASVSYGCATAYWPVIDPLPPESAEALLHALLGDDASLKPLARLLIGRKATLSSSRKASGC